MILEDYHLHTTFCDGKDTPEQMVKTAIKMSLKRLGFSAHSYTSFDEEYCLKADRISEYKNEIARLKEKYKDKIEIYCGIEQDLFSQIKPEGYDYVIGSVHYVKKNGEYIPVDGDKKSIISAVNKHYGGDIYAFCEDYFFLVGSLAKTDCSLIGHFDLITKLNRDGGLFSQTHPRYLSAAKGALDTLLKANKTFEINTGGISRGYIDHPYPDIPMLKYIVENKGKLVFTSDAHRAEHLCFQFDRWSNLLEKIKKEYL